MLSTPRHDLYSPILPLPNQVSKYNDIQLEVPLTGHSITHSVSVITNMTVSKQNLKLSMRNEYKGRTRYSSHSPTLILQSSDCEVLHYY